VEIEVRLGDGATPTLARIGGSRRLVQLDRLRRWFRPWAPFSSVTVTVPVRQCLVRLIQLPRAALSRADEILRVDLERTTPFGDDVLTGWYRPPQKGGDDLVSLHHVILKQELITPVLEKLHLAGLPINAVVPIDGDGGRLPVNLLPSEQRSSAAVMVGLRGLVLGCIVALYVFAIAATWMTVSSLDTALTKVEGDVSKSTEEAREVSRLASEADTLAAKLAAVRLSKIGATTITAIWEEVTRLLPQSTWLTSLRVEDDMVHIDGNASNASELIPLPARSPMFTNVTFASPVTRDQQRGLERFQIKMLVAKRDAAKADPAQSESK
jgi:general secretion pathway protein L